VAAATSTRHASAVRFDWFGVGLGGLILATLATRLPFMTLTLYAFDSANYALAVRDFYNVAFHQPHPPGYPLYVFFARGIDVLVHDANRSLIIEGILWSLLAVGCTSMLARRLFGRSAGLLAGLLLVFTVGFWGYGEVAYPYVALAGETAALALVAQTVLVGRRRFIIGLALAWAICLGVRWDGAMFDVPLAFWAAYTTGWRLRAGGVALAGLVVVAWAVPMVALSGGWDAYRHAMDEYLHVWSPQSAYVVGDFASGGDTQATYNLNFLVNYLRQMLGIGLLLVAYLLGRRFTPGVLAADGRWRFMGLWTVPPLLVYVFAHLGEPGYVLSLAPQAAILTTAAILDLRGEMSRAADVLRARGWRWLAPARAAHATSIVLVLGIIGWNAQAFARGVGPGRLPDLRAHDATTSDQVAFVQQQPVDSTLVLAHDIFRQLHYYVPQYRVELLFSEYVPNFQTAVIRTDLASDTRQIVVLDALSSISPADAGRQIVLRDQPHVSVWLVNAVGAAAVEHGFGYLRLIR
jgi:hypothetical protein